MGISWKRFRIFFEGEGVDMKENWKELIKTHKQGFHFRHSRWFYDRWDRICVMIVYVTWDKRPSADGDDLQDEEHQKVLAPPLQPKPMDGSLHIWYHFEPWSNISGATVGIFEFPPRAWDIDPFFRFFDPSVIPRPPTLGVDISGPR